MHYPTWVGLEWNISTRAKTGFAMAITLLSVALSYLDNQMTAVVAIVGVAITFVHLVVYRCIPGNMDIGQRKKVIPTIFFLQMSGGLMMLSASLGFALAMILS